MDEEYGPWIVHDGKGCPCIGQMVIFINRDGQVLEVRAGEECFAAGVDPNGSVSAWVWGLHMRPDDVIRYRVRRPKGLSLLRQIALTTKMPKKQKEKA